jgi:hypothetical protein
MSEKDHEHDDPMYRAMFNIPPAEQDITWGPVRSFMCCTSTFIVVAAVLGGIHELLN